ncbi:hypothetical protein FDK38_002922 [Candidozyma auris]|nr:hypothetical protein FDK38_002922 [[Candida] auris]
MGYPSELKPSIRKVADNVVTLSVPFTMMGIARTGGRMAIFRYGDEIIYWSPIPYGEYIEEAIDLLVSPRGSEKVTHLFVVNKEHNLVAKSYLEKYPDIKIVAGEKALGKDTVHYEFEQADGNKVIEGTDAKNKFEAEGDFWSNFQFVYLSSHLAKELVLYEKTHKILFEGDLLMELNEPDAKSNEAKFECYSPSTGFEQNHNPYTGFSYFCRGLRAGGWLSRVMHAFFSKTWTAEGAKGVRLVYEELNFDTIVQCHGNVIINDPKGIYLQTYPWLKKEQ